MKLRVFFDVGGTLLRGPLTSGQCSLLLKRCVAAGYEVVVWSGMPLVDNCCGFPVVKKDPWSFLLKPEDTVVDDDEAFLVALGRGFGCTTVHAEELPALLATRWPHS